MSNNPLEEALRIRKAANPITKGLDGSAGVAGPTGATGPAGATGATGPAGVGIPDGGTSGQILAKINGVDYNTEWIDNYANYTSVVKHKVKAGVALTKGMAVYVTSADGTNMIVSKASASAESTSSKTMGLIAESLAVNGQGYVITEGLLSGLNTDTATIGDPVWLSTVAGELIYGLTLKPHAPTHLVFIGIVTRVSATVGEIFVKVQNGFELDELHNVDLKTTPPTDGQAILWEASSGLWKPGTVSGGTGGYTGDFDAGHANTVYGGIDPIDGGYA